ncbi:MAG: glycosyltransferase [Candidatus Thermoplasmatota archaeon]|nr:glycosyltransferase [Candidatus Thermoplasmatota archaeon]
MSDPFIVIPTLNEQEGLDSILRAVPPQYTVIVVDDGSIDGTQQVALSYTNTIFINRGKKLGLVSAYIEGIGVAVSKGADYICVMDGDGQHDPSVLEKMVIFAKENKADLVVGSRYSEHSKNKSNEMHFIRKLISRTANSMFRMSFGKYLHDATSGLRVYSKKAAIELLNNPPRQGSYAGQVEIVSELHAKGLNIMEFPVDFSRRIGGESKLRSRDVLSFFTFILFYGNLWKYLTVGLLGLILNEFVLYSLSFQINYVFAEFAAIEVTVLTNFLFNEYWTFRGRILNRKISRFVMRIAKFNVASYGGVIINFLVFVILSTVGLNILVSNFIGINLAFIYRYVVSVNAVWI